MTKVYIFNIRVCHLPTNTLKVYGFTGTTYWNSSIKITITIAAYLEDEDKFARYICVVK
jgi:amino acid permease